MKTFIGFEEALHLTLAHAPPCGTKEVPLLEAAGLTAAEDVSALVDSPSLSTSRKDGYAVFSEDLKSASANTPARLALKGSLSAGGPATTGIARGEAVRVTTGARLPQGADAIVSEEFCREEGGMVRCMATAAPGRNILKCATDVAAGDIVVRRGELLTPPLLGLAAAAGRESVVAVAPPRVAVIATGDEVLAPGRPMAEGQLYASNLVEICAWLKLGGIPYEALIVGDRVEEIRDAVRMRLERVDVFLTSGGAWGSEKDLIFKAVETMDWEGIYHRVRMGPGKPVGFGLLAGKPFFVLPGGPPSNEMAFLQLALPALRKMAGSRPQPFPTATACLGKSLPGTKGWTEFIHARLEQGQDGLHVHPYLPASRLVSMARKQAIIRIPEDREELTAGETIAIQLFDPAAAGGYHPCRS